jgi:hypothetical protein
MSVVRACLGWYRPSTENPDGRMTPAHGWLLPQTEVVPASRTSPAFGKQRS